MLISHNEVSFCYVHESFTSHTHTTRSHMWSHSVFLCTHHMYTWYIWEICEHIIIIHLHAHVSSLLLKPATADPTCTSCHSRCALKHTSPNHILCVWIGFLLCAHATHKVFRSLAHSLCCFASSLCFATCPYHESTTTAFHKVFRWKSTLKHWASRFFSSLWSLGSCLIQYVDRFFPSDHIATRKRNDSVALQHGLRLCAEGSIVQTPGYLSTTPNFSSRPIEMWRSWCNMWGLQPFWALTSSQAKCGKTCPPKHFELFHAPPTRGNPWKEWCNPIMSGINR